ncbi:MAG: 4'-phosphopantetheinyl transferase superfamily protein, partial [Deltaproteobacteria bacterium]
DNEVHVWCESLRQSSSSRQRLIQTLSPEERMRAERFCFDQHRREFIVRRGVLREMLGRYLDLEPNQMQFNYGPKGKPILAGDHGRGPLGFNLSHSCGLALYVVSREGRIGVDLEHIRLIAEMQQIVTQHFSALENKVFQALPTTKKQEAFFSGWTRKEAFVKAIGDGLSMSLDTFDVSMVPGGSARVMNIRGDSKSASRWLIRDLRPAPGFVGALAMEGESLRLHCWQWTEEFPKRSRFKPELQG